MSEGKSVPVMLRLPPQLAERIDAFRREEADLPSRPEAVRRILAEWFENKDATPK